MIAILGTHLAVDCNPNSGEIIIYRQAPNPAATHAAPVFTEIDRISALGSEQLRHELERVEYVIETGVGKP